MELKSSRRYDRSTVETLKLKNGRRITIRMVRAEDKELMKQGLERLSPESRYRRFFVNKASFSSAELRYLTEVDGENHFAIGASANVEGQEAGVGVARFVRSGSEPNIADAAIVVADDWQGMGVGRLLFSRLVEAARERGIDRFRAEVLIENEPARELMRQATQVINERADGSEVLIDMLLPEKTDDLADHRESFLYRVFALAAAGQAQVTSLLKRLAELANVS